MQSSLTTAGLGALAAATAAFAGGSSITLTHLASTPRAGYDAAAAEIVAFDPATKRAFVVNGLTNNIDIFDLTIPGAPVAAGSISMLPYGGGVQSVAAKNGRLACAVQAAVKTDPGTAVLFDTSGNLIASVTVGALPDMICFTPDGTKVLTANEGEPDLTYSVDPEGSISIIDVSGKTISQANVTTLGFNGLAAGVIDPSVRAFGPGNPSIGQDLEPVATVFEAVIDAVHVPWQLAGFAHGGEAQAPVRGQGRTNDEAP